MTDLEYRLIKEAVKIEILQEMEKNRVIKPEPALSAVKRSQQIIFDDCFPGLKETDVGRYWKLKEAVVKLTNLCRFRANKLSSWDSAIRSEVEAESAIATYEAIAKVAAEIIGNLNKEDA